MIRDCDLKSHILITGADGFIGKYITEHLTKLHPRIRLLRRLKSRISDKTHDSGPEVIYTKDMFSETDQWWRAALENVSHVYHLAWYTNPADYLSSPINLDCLTGSIRIGRLAADMGVKKFVSLGSCFEYEVTGAPLDTGSRLNPKTLYAACKVSLYYVLQELFDSKNIPFLWCRIFNVFGDGEPQEKLFSYITRGLKSNTPVQLNGGDNVRDFIHVTKAVEDILRLSDSDFSGAANICTGVGLSVKDFATKIATPTQQINLLEFRTHKTRRFDPDSLVGIPTLGKAHEST